MKLDKDETHYYFMFNLGFGDSLDVSINKETFLIESFTKMERRMLAVPKILKQTITYNHNGMPINIHTISKITKAPATTRSIKLKWEGGEISLYEDNLGNWYDKNVISFQCPFSLPLEELPLIVSHLNRQVQSSRIKILMNSSHSFSELEMKKKEDAEFAGVVGTVETAFKLLQLKLGSWSI